MHSFKTWARCQIKGWSPIFFSLFLFWKQFWENPKNGRSNIVNKQHLDYSLPNFEVEQLHNINFIWENTTYNTELNLNTSVAIQYSPSDNLPLPRERKRERIWTNLNEMQTFLCRKTTRRRKVSLSITLSSEKLQVI